MRDNIEFHIIMIKIKLTGGLYTREIFWEILSAGDFLRDFVRRGFYPPDRFLFGDFILQGIFSSRKFFLDPS